MMKKLVFLLALGVGLFLSTAPWVKAQGTSGTISGTVSDPSGAMIPKAQVTITNQATGLTRTVEANDAGFFTAPQLSVGTYTISASAPGFKKGSHTGIGLHVNDELTLPIVLQLGQVTQTVEVTGGATMVELRSSEVASTVGSQQVRELPLNGRSFVQLTLLVPGASADDNLRPGNTGLLSGVDISMSGSAANTNAWLVDGVDNVDHGSGRTILVFPSIDSIEEFKVERNSYGADMPSVGGAAINVVTKGGGNAFHGSVYEFLRNDKLNAANFFLNRGGANKGELRFNDFGYTVGGPIKKDKAFFFWSQEWRREIRGVTRKASVPTALERQGIFSGPHSGGLADPVDPYTGLPFPGGQIPSTCNANGVDCLSPAGLALLNLYPMPTNSNTIDNWVAAVPTRVPTRQEQIRGDVNITDKNVLMVRYTQDAWSNPAPNFASEGGLWGDTGFPTVDSSWDQPAKNLAVRLTSTLGPSVVNQFQFSYSNNRIFITRGLGESINADINSKIPELFTQPSDRSHAVFWGDPLSAPTGGLWNAAPWNNAHDIYVWKDDFSKIQGNHTLKFGGSFSNDTKDEDCCGADVRAAQFWGPTAVPGGAGQGGGWGHPDAPGNGGNVTGNGLADLLLKGAYWGSNQQSALPRSKVRWKDIESYGTDTWRATPRLTVNYGARWTILPPSTQADDRIANFVLSLYDPALGNAATNGLIYPASFTDQTLGVTGGSANLRGLDVGRALRKSSYNTIAPRVGFAWDPTGQGKWAIRAGAGIFYGRADLSQPIGELLLNPPFNITYGDACGRPLDALQAVGTSGCPLPVPGAGTAGNAADTNWKIQSSYQWNFTIERELWQNTKVELSYVGNKGSHLPLNYDLNRVPADKRLDYARVHFDSSSSVDENSFRLLFPLRGSEALPLLTNGGNSSYHAFQLFMTKRFSKSYMFQVAYSYSKTLSTTGLNCCQDGNPSRITDPTDVNYDRGLSGFDRTHILTVNGVYRFPDMSGKAALVRGVLGGWEGTGIYQYSTGSPLTITINNALTGSVRGLDRPDIIGDTEGPKTADQWFNTNAYTIPRSLGRLGNSARGSVRGPAINNADLAIYKNFALPWREGMSVQFRFETFNTFNHTQFLGINTGYQPNNLQANLANDTLECRNGSGVDIFPNCDNNNSQFGRPGRARDSREIQLALKFIF